MFYFDACLIWGKKVEAALKAVKQLPIQASALAADAEQEIETVKLEKPKHDVEYKMDSDPDLDDEPDNDKLDKPNATDDPDKLAEPGAFTMLPHVPDWQLKVEQRFEDVMLEV